jgi:hypothetical protein
MELAALSTTYNGGVLSIQRGFIFFPVSRLIDLLRYVTKSGSSPSLF